jgi:hypothetical protein
MPDTGAIGSYVCLGSSEASPQRAALGVAAGGSLRSTPGTRPDSTGGNSLADGNARVVFVPVRHHSPTCARVVVELARRIRPDAILIEGPADFNDRLDELALDHRLPIAIYTYARLKDGSRRGAYYPFCVYSPEWQALQEGRRLGATVRFIDLPWADLAASDRLVHRYADAEMRGGAYVAMLCRRLGVDDFDALWDDMFEIDPGLTADGYLERGHAFCGHLRRLDGEARPVDVRREAFMADQIRRAMDEFPGRLLVVTGGFHSPALHERLFGEDLRDADEPSDAAPAAEESGIALTPYSYERLDNLKGYESGMPNPGFYHQAWDDRHEAPEQTHRRLLARVAKVLRERGQPISAADLIAAETTARGLAALRGHAVVWRRDLVDGIAAALVKDESGRGQAHPLLEAVHEVFRGGEIGRLAEGSRLPPLVMDLKRRLADQGWEPSPIAREVELDLDTGPDREKSRLLHQVALLGISGFDRLGGTDFARRDDLSRCWERWRLRWSPDHDASAIEAARYGPTLPEAAAARLIEAASKDERSAEAAARLLLDAVLAGLDSVAGELQDRLTALIRQDGDFLGVAGALGHLLHLHRYDATLGSRGRGDIAALLGEAFGRGLWLLEGLGQVAGQDAKLVDGVRSLLETCERSAGLAGIDRQELVDVLGRVGSEPSQTPVVRGAAFGALWTLGAAEPDRVRAALLLFADPSRLGDFLTGLFGLAREAVQRQPDLILGIDELLAGFADEAFLEALPSLRLAFTYFTPREKHHMATSLLKALGIEAHQPMAGLEFGPEVAARALAFEARLFRAAERYGLRGAAR